MEKRKFTTQILEMVSIFLILLLGSASLSSANPLTDEKITNAVERQLFLNSAVPFHSLDVETYNGIVTLSGTVKDLLAKDQAQKTAQMVKGVRSVVNQITIDPPERSDLSLESDIRVALTNDPATERYEVFVEANDGVVTLTGTVDSWQEKQISAYVAKGVAGVKEIYNNIEIDYQVERSDEEIEADIQRALDYDLWVDDALIAVDVEDGEVVLSGTVGSAAEKQTAIADAWVTGVESVTSDELEVREWARNENLREGKYVERSDEEIKEAVKDAFFFDPRVSAFEPEVSVDDGFVTLTGIVDNLQAKRAAENDARNVVGVFGVDNYLRVRPEDIPEDAELEADITNSFRRSPFIDRWEMDVSVIDGVVFLNGEADSWYEKAHAENIAARTQGVVDVRNNLAVKYADDYDYYDYYGWNSDYPPLYDSNGGSSGMSDSEIENKIESQFWWSPYVNKDEVNVTVVNGTAFLEGTVDTQREKRFAEVNALEGGAKEVVNNIEVVYKP